MQDHFIIFRGVESNSGIFRGGQSFLFKFRVGLNCYWQFKGGYVSVKEFLGGVRVLQPLEENLRDPYSSGFLTPCLRSNLLSMERVRNLESLLLGEIWLASQNATTWVSLLYPRCLVKKSFLDNLRKQAGAWLKRFGLALAAVSGSSWIALIT